MFRFRKWLADIMRPGGYCTNCKSRDIERKGRNEFYCWMCDTTSTYLDGQN